MRNLVTTLTLAGLVASSLPAAKMQLNEADRRPEPVIADATAETGLALQQLQIPEGMEASLWAAEPMLANPVAFDFDEHGRLFVAETYRYGTSTLDIRGYMDMLEEDMAFRTVEDRARGIVELFGDDAANFAIEGEILRLLEDRDGDGKADLSTAYADQFDTAVDGIASGVLARKGDIYFTNIPHLWKFQGIDRIIASRTLYPRKDCRRGKHRRGGSRLRFGNRLDCSTKRYDRTQNARSTRKERTNGCGS